MFDFESNSNLLNCAICAVLSKLFACRNVTTLNFKAYMLETAQSAAFRKKAAVRLIKEHNLADTANVLT